MENKLAKKIEFWEKMISSLDHLEGISKINYDLKDIV